MNSHYEAVLADLRQMKIDAEAGIRAIERLMAQNGIVPDIEVALPPKPASGSGDASVPTRLLEFLANQPSRSFRFEEILRGLEGVNAKTLRGALARMASQDKIARPSRGKYRAARKPTTIEHPPAS